MHEVRVSCAAGLKPETLVNWLLRHKLEGTVTPTLSVCKERGRFVKEEGAMLQLYSCTDSQFRDELWPDMQQSFGVRCAHLSTFQRGFNGCTENFARPSACPHAAAEM
jgi:hypothetical protein